MKRLVAVLICAVSLSLHSLPADAKSSGSRTYYGGGKHTTSHGGHYTGGKGSSHKGGTYKNAASGNHYGKHK
ncbi:MAG: hypothetical protein AB7M05_19525 [Alphaproteobacteria bacterium]